MGICIKRWCVCGWLTLFLAGFAAAQNESAGRVYIIPIRGMIEPALVPVIKRSIGEAEANNARAIVLAMDTPGGTVDSAQQIVDLLRRLKIPCYTFVERNAFSAGAIIALSTDKIFMAPGSVIGDAMPIMVSPIGGVQEMPADIREKQVSAVAALIRASARRKGYDPELAEAMVRPTGYQLGEMTFCAPGHLLTLTNGEAERQRPNQQNLLSSGTLADIPALLPRVGLDGAGLVEMREAQAEIIGRWVTAFGSIFLIIGLLGIYVEIKTTGRFWPGIVGGISMLIFFWGHHVAGLAGYEDMVLFLLGLTLIAMEVFFFTGTALLGVAGGLMIFWAVLNAMTENYPGGPLRPAWENLQGPLVNLCIVLVVTFLLAVLLARFIPGLPVFNRLVLQRAARRQDGYESALDTSGLIGATGVALCDLHPSGDVRIDQRRISVVTRGEFIPKHTEVQVVFARGNHVVVAEVGQPSGGVIYDV